MDMMKPYVLPILTKWVKLSMMIFIRCWSNQWHQMSMSLSWYVHHCCWLGMLKWMGDDDASSTRKLKNFLIGTQKADVFSLKRGGLMQSLFRNWLYGLGFFGGIRFQITHLLPFLFFFLFLSFPSQPSFLSRSLSGMRSFSDGLLS